MGMDQKALVCYLRGKATQKEHRMEHGNSKKFLTAMRENPDLAAGRIGWLLEGSYGLGPMQMPKRVFGSPRMNRSAALTHMIGAYEWSSPSAMALAGWKKITKGQQAALERAVQGVIHDAETAE